MIGDYLAQTVWWKAATPADAYGQAGHAAAVQTTGRWLEKRRLIRNAEGEQKVSEITVVLDGASTVSPGDQLSSDGTTYLDVMQTSTSRGLEGEIVLRRAYL